MEHNVISSYFIICSHAYSKILQYQTRRHRTGVHHCIQCHCKGLVHTCKWCLSFLRVTTIPHKYIAWTKEICMLQPALATFSILVCLYMYASPALLPGCPWYHKALFKKILTHHSLDSHFVKWSLWPTRLAKITIFLKKIKKSDFFLFKSFFFI